MKNNMKTALTTITVPFSISFLSGVFDWYFEDGFYVLLGFTMVVGLIWAWYVELNRNK